MLQRPDSWRPGWRWTPGETGRGMKSNAFYAQQRIKWCADMCFRITDCLLRRSLCSFSPAMRWLPVRTAKTVKRRKRRRLIVWTIVFEVFKVIACSHRWPAVFGRRKRRSLSHLLRRWRTRRRSRTLTVKTCQRWTSNTSSSGYKACGHRTILYLYRDVEHLVTPKRITAWIWWLLQHDCMTLCVFSAQKC